MLARNTPPLRQIRAVAPLLYMVRTFHYIETATMEDAVTDAIEEVSTITAKGQTTVPKAVRKALGVTYGGKVAFRIEPDGVTLRNADSGHADPALGAFLKLIEADIAAGHNIRSLPGDLATLMRRALKRVKVDLGAPIVDKVEL